MPHSECKGSRSCASTHPIANTAASITISRGGTIAAQRRIITAPHRHIGETPCTQAPARSVLGKPLRRAMAHSQCNVTSTWTTAHPYADAASYQYHCPTKPFSGTAADNRCYQRLQKQRVPREHASVHALGARSNLPCVGPLRIHHMNLRVGAVKLVHESHLRRRSRTPIRLPLARPDAA